MHKDTRPVTTNVGTKQNPEWLEETHDLDMPDSAGDMLTLLSEGDETVTVTVNKKALMRACNMACETYAIAADTAKRNEMRAAHFGKKGRKNKLSAFGL